MNIRSSIISYSIKIFFIFCIALIFSANLFSKTSNTITHRGHQLQIKTIVSVWDRDKKTITINLFPYDLNKDEISEIKQGKAFFVIMLKKKSPGKYWKQPLYAKLEIKLKDNKKTGIEAIESVNWNFLWFKERNNTSFASIPGSNLDKKKFSLFRYTLMKGGELALRYRGKEKLTGEVFEWRLDFTTKLSLQK